jgi:hypothetical protein
MARKEEWVAAMSECLGCTTPQECAEAAVCRIEQEKAAEDRRKLLAAPPDRGITDIVARITAFLGIAGADLEKVQLVFLCDDLWEQGVVEAAFKQSIRNMDLIQDLSRQEHNFQGGVRFMGMRLRIAAGKINGQ